jgi:hypothetical protein
VFSSELHIGRWTGKRSYGSDNTHRVHRPASPAETNLREHPMEFDTGPDVQSGHDINLETSSGSQDLGAATYDSDHDGVADSVIIIDGDHEYMITDSDHDGQADGVHEYDAGGHEIDP